MHETFISSSYNEEYVIGGVMSYRSHEVTEVKYYFCIYLVEKSMFKVSFTLVVSARLLSEASNIKKVT